jgi:E3 ubiquitin-protein ligase UBR1
VFQTSPKVSFPLSPPTLSKHPFSPPNTITNQTQPHRCGGHTGLFLHIRKCCILYLHRESGSWTVAPYLDKFGEVDPSLRRNLQLYLHQRRYDAILRQAWLGGAVPSTVARKLEGEVNTGGWESL